MGMLEAQLKRILEDRVLTREKKMLEEEKIRSFLSQDMRKKEDRIQEIQKNVDDLKQREAADSEQLKAMESEHKREMEKYNNLNRTCTDQRARLLSEIEQLEAELARKKKSLQEVESEARVNQLKTTDCVQKYSEKIRDISSRAERTKTTIEDAVRSLEDAKRQREQTESKKNLLNSEVQKITTVLEKLEKTHTDFDQILQTIGALSDLVSQHSAKATQLKEKLMPFNDREREMQGRITSLLSQKNFVETEMSDKKAEFAANEEKIGRLEKEKLQMIKEKNFIGAGNKAQEIKKVKERNDLYAEELASLRESDAETEKQITDAKNDLLIYSKSFLVEKIEYLENEKIVVETKRQMIELSSPVVKFDERAKELDSRVKEIDNELLFLK